MILKEAARVMSLRDGRAKMSKSDSSDNSRINLTDDTDTIIRKIQRAKTDSFNGVTFDEINRPEASNLLGIYAALSDQSIKNVSNQFSGDGFSQFKIELAELAAVKLKPIATEMQRLMASTGYIDEILKNGAVRASEIAEHNLKNIKNIMGFLIS